MNNQTADIMTENQSKNDRSVEFLYGTKIGKIILELMLITKVPKLLGIFLRSPLSIFYIKKFIEKNSIDMTGFEGRKFKSFNDFFTRQKKIEFDRDEKNFISPADSLLSIFPIDENSKYSVKGFEYTLEDFFEVDKTTDAIIKKEICELSKEFAGGQCLIFRLCATDYHRYCYVDDGIQGKNNFIKGSLYSVQPAACENFRVYTKNRRNWSILETKNFGKIAQIEVGAFSVGGIVNHLKAGTQFKKGDEKGYFDLHGSTIVMLIKPETLKINSEITEYLSKNQEYRIKIGQPLGTTQKQ